MSVEGELVDMHRQQHFTLQSELWRELAKKSKCSSLKYTDTGLFCYALKPKSYLLLSFLSTAAVLDIEIWYPLCWATLNFRSTREEDYVADT